MAELLPIGTRIRFLKDLKSAGDVDYAKAGELGTITHNSTANGTWAIADGQSLFSLGIYPNEFEVVSETPGS